MAAIAGILTLNDENHDGVGELLTGMLELMHHRGPDNRIVRTLPDGKGAMGANEINLTVESTQCSSLSRAPFILFDGHLFNERSSGQFDIELFEEFYSKHGKSCFTLLEGDYTCAIADEDEIILVRDQIGARSLFYGIQNGILFFSTEMKGLKDHIRFGVHELPPGHIYSTKHGLQPFTPFIPDTPEIGDMKQTAETLKELLINAVKKRMDGVQAVSLSGGLDSSIIAAIASQFNPKLQLITGTVDSAPGPDLENAVLMANFLGMEHHIYRITDLDIADFISEAVWYLESFEEDCISGFLSNYYVSTLAKSYTDCILVGEGADELFGGYRTVLKSPKVTSDQHRIELAQKLLDISYNTGLRRLDHGWMANAVAYQTPFLDANVVAFSKKIPMEWKIYGEKQIEKYILREAFRDILPEQITNREKLRFARGIGIDNMMDSIIAKIINPDEIYKRPTSMYGLPFASFKELYYYDVFLSLFPPEYEKQTIRWDPFK